MRQKKKTKPEGELSSPKIARRFVLQLLTYLDTHKEVGVADFVRTLGISDYTWYSWVHGKIKRIGLSRIYAIAGKLNLNLAYMIDCEADKTQPLYKKFVEYNTLYKKLITSADPTTTSTLIRKVAMTCYDVMINEKLPVSLTITNISETSLGITDDMICIDCKVGAEIYRMQIVPGVTISYCFGVINPVTRSQRILHEGTISMTIVVTMAKFIISKLRKEKNPEDDIAASFLVNSREFSKNN